MTRSLLIQDPRTKARNAAERRFRAYGATAIILALAALLWLLISIFSAGSPAFRQTFMTFNVTLDEKALDKEGGRDPAKLASVTTVTYAKLLAKGLQAQAEELGLDTGKMKSRDFAKMISEESAATLRDKVLADPTQIGQTIPFTVLASGRVDGYYKGRVTMQSAANDKNTSPEQLALADQLRAAGVLTTRFNWGFFTMPDASDKRPEAAGLGIAIVGSFLMMLVVLVLSLPIGVASIGLSGGIRAQEPLDGPDRGEYRQSGGGPLHRLRHPWPGDLHQHSQAFPSRPPSSAGLS